MWGTLPGKIGQELESFRPRGDRACPFAEELVGIAAEAVSR